MAGKLPAAKPDDRSRSLADVRTLARILRQYDLSEIEVEANGARLAVRRTAGAMPGAVIPVGAGVPIAAVETPLPVGAAAGEADRDDEDLVVISSPFVGIFYRAPSPESPAFAEVGQVVRKGQTLCIVEAMKLMNEIEAEQDVKIVEVLARNSEPVEYGQGLFRAQAI